LEGIGIGCPGKWLWHHPWRYLADPQTRSLKTWWSGGTASVRLMVGLYDLEGLLQPKQFHDSIFMEALHLIF